MIVGCGSAGIAVRSMARGKLRPAAGGCKRHPQQAGQSPCTKRPTSGALASDAMPELSVAVLGAGGTIGPAIVHDLAASDEVSRLVLLDLDLERARATATTHGAGKTSARAVDARDQTDFAAALEGAEVLVNSASYRVNPDAMRACLAAG